MGERKLSVGLRCILLPLMLIAFSVHAALSQSNPTHITSICSETDNSFDQRIELLFDSGWEEVTQNSKDEFNALFTDGVLALSAQPNASQEWWQGRTNHLRAVALEMFEGGMAGVPEIRIKFLIFRDDSPAAIFVSDYSLEDDHYSECLYAGQADLDLTAYMDQLKRANSLFAYDNNFQRSSIRETIPRNQEHGPITTEFQTARILESALSVLGRQIEANFGMKITIKYEPE